MTEAQTHEAVAHYLRAQYPEVLFYSDMSGVKLPWGLAKKVAGLKATRGIPDLFIAEPKGEYHGCFIELKRDNKIYKKDGKLRKDEHVEEQARVLEHLQGKGYFATFGLGLDHTLSIIDSYLCKQHKNVNGSIFEMLS